MLCDECNKNPAAVHLTRIVNGSKTELNLCEQCARKLGEFEFVIEPKFSLPSLLAGLMDSANQFTPMQVPTTRVCEVCNLTHAEFTRTGRLGCSNCYEVFKDHLQPLVKRIHGATNHAGRTPPHRGRETPHSELHQLRSELAGCVDREEFERAAELRDRIRELERRVDGQESD